MYLSLCHYIEKHKWYYGWVVRLQEGNQVLQGNDMAPKNIYSRHIHVYTCICHTVHGSLKKNLCGVSFGRSVFTKPIDKSHSYTTKQLLCFSNEKLTPRLFILVAHRNVKNDPCTVISVPNLICHDKQSHNICMYMYLCEGYHHNVYIHTCTCTHMHVHLYIVKVLFSQ